MPPTALISSAEGQTVAVSLKGTGAVLQALNGQIAISKRQQGVYRQGRRGICLHATGRMEAAEVDERPALQLLFMAQSFDCAGNFVVRYRDQYEPCLKGAAQFR